MKVAIAGSRGVRNYDMVKYAIEQSGFTISEIISGHAEGVDRLGERYAVEKDIPYSVFLPAWKQQGKKAGLLRNVKMAHEADALIAVWDGKSLGTQHMISTMRTMKKPVYIYLAKDNETTVESNSGVLRGHPR